MPSTCGSPSSSQQLDWSRPQRSRRRHSSRHQLAWGSRRLSKGCCRGRRRLGRARQRSRGRRRLGVQQLLRAEGLVEHYVGAAPADHAAIVEAVDGAAIAVDLSTWLMQVGSFISMLPNRLVLELPRTYPPGSCRRAKSVRVV